MVTGWVGEASGLHEMDMARAGSFREIIALCLPFVAAHRQPINSTTTQINY